jgi:hypothetical protein
MELWVLTVLLGPLESKEVAGQALTQGLGVRAVAETAGGAMVVPSGIRGKTALLATAAVEVLEEKQEALGTPRGRARVVGPVRMEAAEVAAAALARSVCRGVLVMAPRVVTEAPGVEEEVVVGVTVSWVVAVVVGVDAGVVEEMPAKAAERPSASMPTTRMPSFGIACFRQAMVEMEEMEETAV